MNLGFRALYDQDIKPWFSVLYRDVHRVYVGPGWRSMNGYERLGRFLCGIALAVFSIALTIFVALFVVSIWKNIVDAVVCLFKSGCTVSLRHGVE